MPAIGTRPLPSQAGVVMVVVPSLYPFSDSIIRHPGTVWVKQWQLQDALRHDGPLKNLLDAGDVTTVFLCVAATPEKFEQFESYLRANGIKRIIRTTTGEVGRLVGSLPVPKGEKGRKSPVFKPATNFRFKVLRGKQHEMSYLVAGFRSEDFPPELLSFPRVTFIPRDEVFAMGKPPDGVQVGILSPDLDEDDMTHVRGQLVRAGLPPENIVIERDLKKRISWFRGEFDIPFPKNGNHAPKPRQSTLIVSCPKDAAAEVRGSPDIIWWDDPTKEDCSHLPQGMRRVFVHSSAPRLSRLEIKDEAARRGALVVDFDDPREIAGALDASAAPPATEPKVVALNLNLAAIPPEVLANPLYKLYSTRDTEKLPELLPSARLVVFPNRNINPNTVQRFKGYARNIGATFIELAGGTGEFNRWLQRTNVLREIGEAEQPLEHSFASAQAESRATFVAGEAGVSGGSAETENDAAETAFAETETAETEPVEASGQGFLDQPKGGAMARRKGNGGGPTVKELIKKHWVAADNGNPAKLREAIATHDMRQVSQSSVNTAKWQLIHKDGWKPPKAAPRDGSEADAPAVKMAPAPAGATNPPGPLPESPEGLIRRGLELIAQGTILIQQAAGTVASIEQQNKLMQPFFAAMQQVSATMQGGKKD